MQDSKRARELYTLRVGDNSAADLRLLFSPAPSLLATIHSLQRSKNKPSGPAENSLFKHTSSWPWTLNTFGENLNTEGNLRRTEATLGRPQLHSLYVVLMSCFVPTVAFFLLFLSMLIESLYFVWLTTGGRLSEPYSSMWYLNIVMFVRRRDTRRTAIVVN